MTWTLESISSTHTVRRLTTADIALLLPFCRANTTYYKYCPPLPSAESLAADLTTLPPRITPERKYYLGFFQDEQLVAVLDIIAGYPCEQCAFIGFFMTAVHLQRRGLGSAIIAELLCFLRTQHFSKVRLAWIRDYQQAEKFWRKQGFIPLGTTNSHDGHPVILAELLL